MTETFFVSDTHFGHKNILTFTDLEGRLIRPFSCIEEHDEYIVAQWNSVVSPSDKVYHLGDIAFSSAGLKQLDRCNGKKTLIKGNHDTRWKKNRLHKYFNNVHGVRQLDRYWLTHVPMHPECVETNRVKLNLHGHLHVNRVPNNKYWNVSLESINYIPLSLTEVEEYYDALSRGDTDEQLASLARHPFSPMQHHRIAAVPKGDRGNGVSNESTEIKSSLSSRTWRA